MLASGQRRGAVGLPGWYRGHRLPRPAGRCRPGVGRRTTETVRAGRRSLAIENDQDQRADRDDADQHPPSRPVYIVQAANSDGQRRDVVRDDPEGRDEGWAALAVAKRCVDDQGDDAADEDDKRKHPEIGAGGSGLEVEVPPHGVEVVVHSVVVPVRRLVE